MSNNSVFRAGVARGDITPDHPELLSGTGMGRRVPTIGVIDPLSVESLALELNGQLAFLVTSDLREFLPSEMSEIRRRIAERTGCDYRRVLMSSTHTHSSSPEAASDALLAQLPGDPAENRKKAEAARVASDAKRLDAFVQSCVRAQANLRPAEFAATSVPLKERMGENRRMRLSNGTCINCWGAGAMAFPGEKYVGKAGPIDPNITVAAWRHMGASQPFAVLTSYASHIHLYEIPGFSGEVGGACKRKIESKIPGAIAMYAAGTGGDIAMQVTHPIPPGDEQVRVKWFRDSTDLLGERFASAVAPAVASMKYTTPKRMVHEYFSRNEDAKEIRRITVINALLLDDVAFLTLPGEIFADLGGQLAKASPARQLLTLGYNGSDFRYIPTPLALEQGSYEVMRGPALSDADEVGVTPAGKKFTTTMPRPDEGLKIIDQSVKMLRRLVES